jgi:hypothetical protein
MAEARVFNAEACRFTHILYLHAVAKRIDLINQVKFVMVVKLPLKEP